MRQPRQTTAEADATHARSGEFRNKKARLFIPASAFTGRGATAAHTALIASRLGRAGA